MRFTFTTVLSALAAIATATFTPSGSDPTGNPIGHPELGELMTAGEPFTITWTPTTSGPVSLILLQGPSKNVIPILTIVDSTDNTGSYTWTVPTNLAPGTSGYGIQLIAEDGSFQYSPQCGIENPGYDASSPSSVSYGASVTMTLQTGANYTGLTAMPTSTSSYTFVATATGNATVPIVTPTNEMTVPATLRSSTVLVTPSTSHFGATPATSEPASTGAAVKNVGAGFGFVAGLVGALVL